MQRFDRKEVFLLANGLSKKLTIFITIDTEDSYFDVPRLITGEGLEGAPGVFKILDMTEKYGFRSNVFLDVYSHTEFQHGVLQGIARSIHNRGHAVELHTHPDTQLNFYKRNIYCYAQEEQVRILEYGKHLIRQWTGENPMAHRGGSYAINEDTLDSLHQVGIPIDSTLFFQHRNNKIQERLTVNKVTSYSHTLEVPVTYVRLIKTNGDLVDSKFDLDALSLSELIQVIYAAKDQNLRTLTLFLHSFSLIKKQTKSIKDQDDSRALFKALSRGGSVKCEIYGADESDLLKYDQLLSYIDQDPEIEVLTLREWYKTLEARDYGSDAIPVIHRSYTKS